jgi:tRNA threonylcarbamoyladenosine biosynthesis protein TsaB
MILTIRTDKPEAEIGLFQDDQKLRYETWQAHRELAETIHTKISDILDGRTLNDLTGIVFYKGPGSFTGLRIGASVANALAYSLGVPVVGTSGPDWIEKGISGLGESGTGVVPDYGAPAQTNSPKK